MATMLLCFPGLLVRAAGSGRERTLLPRQPHATPRKKLTRTMTASDLSRRA
jgi:hypothetical protein